MTESKLPESRGIETLACFRTVAPSLPVIILTGLEDENAALEAVSRRAQEYLVKGRVNGASVVGCIRYAIQRHRAAAEELRERTQAKSGRVFAFQGVKGGVGNTAVVPNVAARLAQTLAEICKQLSDATIEAMAV